MGPLMGPSTGPGRASSHSGSVEASLLSEQLRQAQKFAGTSCLDKRRLTFLGILLGVLAVVLTFVLLLMAENKVKSRRLLQTCANVAKMMDIRGNLADAPPYAQFIQAFVQLYQRRASDEERKQDREGAGARWSLDQETFQKFVDIIKPKCPEISYIAYSDIVSAYNSANPLAGDNKFAKDLPFFRVLVFQDLYSPKAPTADFYFTSPGPRSSHVLLLPKCSGPLEGPKDRLPTANRLAVKVEVHADHSDTVSPSILRAICSPFPVHSRSESNIARELPTRGKVNARRDQEKLKSQQALTEIHEAGPEAEAHVRSQFDPRSLEEQLNQAATGVDLLCVVGEMNLVLAKADHNLDQFVAEMLARNVQHIEEEEKKKEGETSGENKQELNEDVVDQNIRQLKEALQAEKKNKEAIKQQRKEKDEEERKMNEIRSKVQVEEGSDIATLMQNTMSYFVHLETKLDQVIANKNLLSAQLVMLTNAVKQKQPMTKEEQEQTREEPKLEPGKKLMGDAMKFTPNNENPKKETRREKMKMKLPFTYNAETTGIYSLYIQKRALQRRLERPDPHGTPLGETRAVGDAGLRRASPSGQGGRREGRGEGCERRMENTAIKRVDSRGFLPDTSPVTFRKQDIAPGG
ncbi:hypothetical protein CBR_g11199 [Chara braunii]|uniref:Uncharacterized protein n=1 Tax=Chara braunii TaxID=69332 RepID=A0A388KQB7_CHABU|nr:hypothetical protein CBR_g11199 [Chara braunii]|eukprot:GBG72270.1 hypothetical protein CBR_g11199 [Chara braunii]